MRADPTRSPSDARRGRRAGYTFLEVQVAFVVLGIALAGFCPLIVMQLRMTRKLQAQFNPGTTYALIPTSGAYAYDASGNIIAFASGESAADHWARKLGAMAAFRPSSSLAGFVYLDLNDDGIKQPLEPGIAGATVTLSFSDAQGQSVSLGAQTNSSGAYMFSNLAPGTYAITEAQPSGYADGQDAIGTQGGTAGSDALSSIAIGAGVNGTGNNFGEVGSSLAGFVYVDGNGDGVRQDDEPGLANTIVILTGSDRQGNEVSLATRTNNAGAYAFAALQPGIYAINETTPTGYADGPDAAGTQGGTAGDDVISDVALGVGDVGVGNNFGEHVTDSSFGSLGGFVYVDRNRNGAMDAGEPGIAGAELTLTGTDDAGRTVTLVTTTDGSGGYAFTNLTPGTYSIAEATPSGYTDGQDAVGTQGGTAGDDLLANLPIDAGTNGYGNNFGEYGSGSSGGTTSSSLSGYVYIDVNQNGLRDQGEPGIAGVSLSLAGSSSGVTTTAPTGYYLFANLSAGTYTISETTPAGYTDGLDSAGTASGTAQDDQVVNIGLGAQVAATGYNFGEHLTDQTLGSLSGSVYVDQNNNGAKDAGEPGIGGVTLTLTGIDVRSDSITVATVTNADGSYLIPGLSAGAYAIRETAPSNYLDGQDNAGLQGATVGNDLLSDIALGQGVNGTGNNFGERQYQVSIVSVAKDAGAGTLTVQVQVNP